MFKLKIEKAYQYLKMNVGNFMAHITPTFKMRRLYLWWAHTISGNAFRRIISINKQLFEINAVTYSCNMCGNVVLKGSLKYGIVLNCPSCGCVFSVLPDHPRKFQKMKLIRSASTINNFKVL